MRTTSRRLLRYALSGLSFLAIASTAGHARAEADTFGTGDGHSGAKTASTNEIINTYAALTADAAAGATTLSIGTTTGASTPFAAGDLVLIWHATGTSPTDAPLASSSPVNLDTLAGGVGRYEFARVSAASAGSLTLTKPLVSTWTAKVTQVVRVPEYTNVTVDSGTGFAAQPWTGDTTAGFTGGILVFLANGTITNNGRIHADKCGFRGGADLNRSNLVLSCPNSEGGLQQGYAPKGEGVVDTRYGSDTNGGRGNWANAAGGGNCVESGGGGGGNAGQGGSGGDSIVAGVTGTDRGGLGGAKLTYTLASPTTNTSDVRITMGGGGGSGEQKDNQGSGGGAGGGAVLIRANVLAGTGIIGANGQTAENATVLNLESDGAGGGGAGGTILLRVVQTLDCGRVEALGGKGGDTVLVGTSVFGPGGGGGGGRIVVQTTTRGASCVLDATAGANGKAGDGTDRNATPGTNGSANDGTAPKTDPNYCFTNSSGVAQCAGSLPCAISTGYCAGCRGGLGSSTGLDCPDPSRPVCVNPGANGTCEACNGDYGGSASAACPAAGSPYCFSTGQNAGTCGKCTSDSDCTTGTHAGPKCNVQSGACGNACTSDSDCQANQWCGQNVCIPKTANGQPVTDVPPYSGDCTADSGNRTCTAGVCEPIDDRCGYRNGTGCSTDGQCRSDICFSADHLCGKPVGEPCSGNGQCRSDNCNQGVCTGCTTDDSCPLDKVCDTSTPGGKCVSGCIPGAHASDGGAVHGACPSGSTCVVPDGGTVGQCQSSSGADGGTDGGSGADSGDGNGNGNGNGGDGGAGDDAGDTYHAGLIEGGGCSCRTPGSSTPAPFAIGGAVFGVMLLARRRRASRIRGSEIHDNEP